MTSNAVQQLKIRQVFQEYAEVISQTPQGLVVRTAATELLARRAFSCVVALQPGDRVLVATEEEGDSFVLAVLSRADDVNSTTAIEVEGDLELRARNGSITVAAREGVEVVTPQVLRLTSAELVASAAKVRVVSRAVDVFSTRLNAELVCVRTVVSKLDSVCQRVRSHVGQAYRTVEEVDQLRAGHIDYKAEGNAHFRADNTLVTARDLVKLNADQVHIS